MNKQDIAIVVLLVAVLFGWMHYQNKANAARRAAWEAERAAAATNEMARAAISAEAAGSAGFSAPAGADAAPGQPAPAASAPQAPAAPAPANGGAEQASDPPRNFDLPVVAALTNAELAVSISSRGGAVASATLLGYRQTIDKNSPPVVFDYNAYNAMPLLALDGVDGLGILADFALVSQTATSAVLRAAAPSGVELTRTIALAPGYRLEVEDSFRAADGTALALPETQVSIGTLSRFSTANTSVLSVDSLPAFLDRHGRFGKVLHWESKHLLNQMFGVGGGGCSGAPNADGLPLSVWRSGPDAPKWVALKTRFFAMVFTSDAPMAGYSVRATRYADPGPLRIASVAGKVGFPAAVAGAGQTLVRHHSLYVGPKKLSVLRRFSAKTGEIMEFGMWGFLCVIILPLLNFLNFVFHNYGVAIIVLTIMVRLRFWPLTRKSNESMKKMGEIQPQLKEIQAKFKDDPAKLQQETMKLYRDNHVNPMASCLPMLIQIPVFIALFVVLRSATELRFAPFLWIRDLSEPENLLKGVLPGLPALNILPFLMAGTMFLQSKLTPSMGDPQQQRMMMWMMPLMMFVMFYPMPSALLLYWTVSQLLAIVQLLRQRRARAAATPVAADGVIDGDALSRQERRRRERDGSGD